MERDSLFLQHIRDAISAIEEYTGNISESDFMSKHIIQDAVQHEILIIGEAANNLSHEFLEKYNQIPWHAIIGMRNQIVHGYFRVDLREIWKTVQKDIPELKTALQNL